MMKIILLGDPIGENTTGRSIVVITVFPSNSANENTSRNKGNNKITELRTESMITAKQILEKKPNKLPT